MKRSAYKQDTIKSIRTLLKEQYTYSHGLTIIKELIQNANDANAEQIHIFLSDGITIDNINVSKIGQPLLNHKAILIYNDGEFTEKDEKGLEQIYSSEKDPNSIGHFGLGLKSIHHLCDMFFYAFYRNGEWLLGELNPWLGTDSHPEWNTDIDEIDNNIGKDFLKNIICKYLSPNKIQDKGFFSLDSI